MISRLDAWQQRHPVVSIPVAVGKKYGDDGAGRLAALVAYYAFFAIFPLLLVLVTLLGLALKDNPELQQRILDSALAQFPVIGDQIRNDVKSLGGSGLSLVIGLVLTFIGARGMANAMQYAANSVWGVPVVHRAQFPLSLLKSMALLVVVGGGLLASSVITGYATSLIEGTFSRWAGVVLSTLLNILVFAASFRIATARVVSTRALIPGAILAAVGWTALQLVGTLIVTQSIARASSIYGFFAVVIGLLTWLIVAASITLFALEIDVVLHRRLWPRALFAKDPMTEADRRMATQYAQSQQRFASAPVEVTFDAHPDKNEGLPGGPS